MAEQRRNDQDQTPPIGETTRDPVTGIRPVGPIETEPEGSSPDPEARNANWSMAAKWFLLSLLLIFLVIAYFWTRGTGGAV
jgi:hypothetical protein